MFSVPSDKSNRSGPCYRCQDRYIACSDHCRKPEYLAWRGGIVDDQEEPETVCLSDLEKRGQRSQEEMSCGRGGMRGGFLPNDWTDKYVQCPFFICVKMDNGIKRICCESPVPESKMSILFCENQYYSQQINKFCRGRYQDCRIYRMNLSLYDEEA